MCNSALPAHDQRAVLSRCVPALLPVSPLGVVWSRPRNERQTCRFRKAATALRVPSGPATLASGIELGRGAGSDRLRGGEAAQAARRRRGRLRRRSTRAGIGVDRPLTGQPGGQHTVNAVPSEGVILLRRATAATRARCPWSALRPQQTSSTCPQQARSQARRRRRYAVAGKGAVALHGGLWGSSQRHLNATSTTLVKALTAGRRRCLLVGCRAGAARTICVLVLFGISRVAGDQIA